MIANLNVRVLTNGAIFVQYQEDGKAKDAAFMNWSNFIEWLAKAVGAPIACAYVTPVIVPRVDETGAEYTIVNGVKIYTDDNEK